MKLALRLGLLLSVWVAVYALLALAVTGLWNYAINPNGKVQFSMVLTILLFADLLSSAIKYVLLVREQNKND